MTALTRQQHRRHPMRRSFMKAMFATVAAAALAVFGGTAAAQGAGPAQAGAASYPDHPVRIIVPFAPGGATDLIARLIARHLGDSLHQTFIVDNKPGADSALGTAMVARAAPDGYTLLFTNDATFVLNPLLLHNLPYDAHRDLVPVATASYLNLALAVPGSLPVRTFQDLVAYTKANSGKLSYGSTGVGSQPQLMGEAYKKLTGTDIVHVPYKSTGLALTDVLGGRLVFGFPAISSAEGFVKSGQLRILAISGDRRSPLLPDVPTFKELGYDAMDIGAWNAFLAPAGTPRPIVDKLNGAINAALRDADVDRELANRGMLPMVKTPSQFGDYMRSESERMAAILKTTGIKVDQ
jgi:tripartite-type tricarboxylate transporter receptor subunit TctC